MQHTYSYQATLAATEVMHWRIEDIIGGEKRLDFSKPFMPESLAQVEPLSFLTSEEKRLLNQIRGNAYLCIFGLVEEFILPFVLDHARSHLHGDDFRVRALLQFAGEEAKHIQLFKRFRQELLKHHWIEEVQHAKLDTLMIEALSENRNEEERMQGVEEYLEIGGFLDAGLKQQVEFDLNSFEQATGRMLTEAEKEEFRRVQLRANRWTYLGSGMTHERVLETLEALTPKARQRVESISPAFC